MENSIIDKVEAEIEIEEAKIDKKKKIISKLKYALVILVIIAEAVTLGVLVYNRFIPNMQYKKAVSYYDEGKTKDALLVFEKLGDYKNSEYYCNTICKENPEFRFDHCKVGDEMTFGKYKYEDVEWVVVDVNGNEVTLLSKYIIDSGAYPENEESWGNYFINQNFFGADKKMVQKAFFLDSDEASDYLTDKPFAKTKPTKQALLNGEYIKSSEYGYGWWLGTSVSYSSKHRVASDNGTLGYNSEYDSTILGIRPAITINISSSETPNTENSSAVSYTE